MKYVYLALIILAICIKLISIYNYQQVKPNLLEINRINELIQYRKIKDTNDIKLIQNFIIDTIKHEFLNVSGVINISSVIDKKKGECYDRSLLLQKIFILNGYKVRPVYIYFVENSKSAFIQWISFFNKNINSHSIFEIEIFKKWYVIPTISKMIKLESLSEYLSKKKSKNKSIKFIRYLNNRNGVFIYPKFLPDIYGL